ncbi:ribokinase [Oculatella sp. LEGE 06141]|uniref:ribokinase n=1 Tax=Oculatella sp. LEGE 06141 TaxID=1828648 RepID=UPI001881DA9B|nr:ribokinase [Oculatella sp. LEGE 06141]MBE9180284.1 ribokinase [Oculatella sp. LEGE 06141]
MNRPHVVVFGSINMDLVARTPKLPTPGETLLGYSFATVPGGKGANQAVAIARLGIPTHMIGRVGNDDFAQSLLASLQGAGVQTAGIWVDDSNHSGVAMIAVDDQSENHIIVVPGVNGQINEADVERLIHQLPGAAALLLQFEIPLPAIQAAAVAANKAGVRVILDPAPAQSNLPSELYSLVDIITPNTVEAKQLVGFPVDDAETAAQAADVLHQRGVNTVVIKLGAKGAFCSTATETFFTPTFAVQAVDTVAAGDAFNGGLAAALAEGRSLREAIRWGAAAGALSVTKPGAQPSLPDRATFDTFLSRHGM